MDNRIMFDLIDTIQVTERWLETGLARKNMSVLSAIEEFDKIAKELEQIKVRPEHSLFTLSDIKNTYEKLVSINSRLKELPTM